MVLRSSFTDIEIQHLVTLLGRLVPSENCSSQRGIQTRWFCPLCLPRLPHTTSSATQTSPPGQSTTAEITHTRLQATPKLQQTQVIQNTRKVTKAKVFLPTERKCRPSDFTIHDSLRTCLTPVPQKYPGGLQALTQSYGKPLRFEIELSSPTDIFCEKLD
ncbi:hypothetical protein LZ32DRAFT_323836 [Colletotrichum eremochloae]|nr:hypothetical protein LZ32DRAFT_323836 [Colletotrichum eremochloae]